VPGPAHADGLFTAAEATGECRVLCFSPRHDLTLAGMSHAEVVTVIELWQSQLVELREKYQWVQIFETRGAISGASGWHTAPNVSNTVGWQVHAHYYPPLLRSADVAKIPASYELLANLQRDITPEAAAAALRSASSSQLEEPSS
jgi:galactose-1-phosphate uridylyltransferase